MYFSFLGMGGSEIILVFLAVLLLFGADKIPDFARMLGKGLREFQKATDEIKRELKVEADDFKRDLEESKRDIEAHVKDVRQSLTEEDSMKPYMDNEDNESRLDKDAKDKSKDKNISSENL